ncbi:MAG TPA: N-acetylglucosamine-6-phosphate deacetylase [Chthoniobacterales bacterium]
MLFAHATLILPDRLLPDAWLAFSQDRKITGLGTGHPPQDSVTMDLQGNLLAPGFIDLHVHGAMQRDAMEASHDAFETISAFHASGGTTSLALTTVAAPIRHIEAVLDAARQFPNTHAGSRLLGIHVEGPYFSLEKPGAHAPGLLRAPEDAAEIAQLLAYSDVITQMTVAPELKGALPLIKRLDENGIIASGGHSDAWAEEAEAAFVHGMRQVTHSYNAMSSARRRGPFREAGLLEYALSEPEIRCELIADGKHVSPTLMRALYQAKGADGIQLVTDATAGAGLSDGELFSLGSLECIVSDGVGMTADGQALAGSTARMIDCIKNMVELAGIPLVEAVRMATLNPALALNQDAQIGVLQPGAAADFAIFSPDFHVLQTWSRSRIIFENQVDRGISATR